MVITDSRFICLSKLKQNFLLVKIKSLQEHLLLKQVFVLIRLVWLLLSKNPIRAESVGSKLKSPNIK